MEFRNVIDEVGVAISMYINARLKNKLNDRI